MFSTDMFGTNIFGSGRTEWIIPEPHEPGSPGCGRARAASGQIQGVMRAHHKPWHCGSPKGACGRCLPAGKERGGGGDYCRAPLPPA